MKHSSSAAEAPVAYHDFIADTGRSMVTGWRWEKRGLIETFNILGRKYVSREEIRRFNARAAAGEFSRDARGAAKKKASTPSA